MHDSPPSSQRNAMVHPQPRRQRAFTLVEMLVTIAIIAMLISVMLPAVQATRSAARRAQCKSNLLQIALAAQNFEMAHEYYPAGVTDNQPGPIQSVASGQHLHHSWITQLLPYMDEAALYNNIQPNVSVYAPAHQIVREITIPTLVCPTSPTHSGQPHSSYAGCHHDVEAPIDNDNAGVFFLNSQIAPDDILDGMAHTVFLGEKIYTNDDLGWMSGTRATLRNTGTPINVDPAKPVVRIPQAATANPSAMEAGVAETPANETAANDSSLAEPPNGEEPVDAEDDFEPGEATDNRFATEQDEAGEPFADENQVADELDLEDEQTDAIASADSVTAAPSVEAPLLVKTPTTVGGFGSQHGGGAHLSFGDGRIQFVSSSISPIVLRQLGNRKDGQLLDPADYRE